MGIQHGFCEPRALLFTLSILFIPRSFVLRWLPHSVLPIGIILIYFCFVLIWPSLVIILYLSLQTATSAQTKQHFFTYAKQHLSAYIKQLCSYRNNKPATQQLIATNMFTFSTYLSLILCTFYQQPQATILPQLFNFCNHVPTQLRNQFHFFLQLFVNKQPIQLIFQQSACQPNHFISTQQFYFLVFYRSSLNFFGQTCHFYAKSSGGAM